MQSHIDWNEIVPRLSKARREELYLEAVMLLAEQPRVKTNGKLPGKTLEERGHRRWASSGIKGGLCVPARRFHVHKEVEHQAPQRGAIGAVWKTIRELKGDFITLEGIYAISKNQKARGDSAVNYLWERRLIDVAPAA